MLVNYHNLAQMWIHVYIRTNPTREPIFVSGTYSTKPFAWATLQLGIQYAWRPHAKGMNQSLIDNLKRKPTFLWTKLLGQKICWGTRSHANHVSSSRAASQSSCSSSPRGSWGGAKKKSQALLRQWEFAAGEIHQWGSCCYFLKKKSDLFWNGKNCWMFCLIVTQLTDKLKGFEPWSLGTHADGKPLMKAGLEMTFWCLAKQSHSMNGSGKDTYICFWIIYWK